MGIFNGTSKRQKTVLTAVFVSISSLVNFTIFTDLTDGFIVALSIVVMEVFIYCYEDLSPAFITVLSGIFSPSFRFVIACISTRNVQLSAERELLDMAYYFGFGVMYALVYSLTRSEKSLKNFPLVIFLSDVFGNTCELILRGVVAGHQILDMSVGGDIVAIAFIRTFIVMMIISAIENYLLIVLSKERDQHYQRLIEQSTVMAEEIRMMDKNVAEVEAVMKKAYALYNDMKEDGYPEDLVYKVLDVAKNTHEVKGDYQNVIGVLKDLYDEGPDAQLMRMSEVVRLVQANVQAMIRKRGLQIEVITRVSVDFAVNESFKMMSILRNLLTNAAEAIAEQDGGRGRIIVTVKRLFDKDNSQMPSDYEIVVKDDGPGIPEDEIGNIFLEGYSTKFNYITGYIQRGLGLSLVRDYVEQDFHGRIEVESRQGKGTTFRITVPESYIIARANNTPENGGVTA